MTYIQEQFRTSAKLKMDIADDGKLLEVLQQVCDICVKAYRQGKKTLFAGNGGSAADSQHFAAELVSRFYFDRPGLPAIALTTDTSILTACGNDYGFEEVYARQIEALGEEGDVFIAISTSGNSPNILKALQAARKKKIITVGFTGKDGGKMKSACDYFLCVPSQDTPRIQEIHALMGHLLCEIIEKEIFKQN